MDGYRNESARRFAAAWEAATGVMGEWAQRVSSATTDAFGKLANDPDIRAAVQAGRAMFPWIHRDCECVCAEAHPDDVGVCDNDAITTRRLATNEFGDVDVPLCAPCATAQGLAEMAR